MSCTARSARPATTATLRPTHAARRTGLVTLAVLSSGCYTYRPLSLDAPPATGSAVRVELTDRGTSDVTPAIGPGVLVLEGALLASGEREGIRIAVASLQRRGEGATQWTGQELALTRDDIRVASERQLSRGRSIAAATGFTAAGVALLVAIARATGLVSGSPGGPKVPPTS